MNNVFNPIMKLLEQQIPQEKLRSARLSGNKAYTSKRIQYVGNTAFHGNEDQGNNQFFWQVWNLIDSFNKKFTQFYQEPIDHYTAVFKIAWNSEQMGKLFNIVDENYRDYSIQIPIYSELYFMEIDPISSVKIEVYETYLNSLFKKLLE